VIKGIKNKIDTAIRMGKIKTLSVKIPEEMHKELELRVPEGEKSNFIREAISEKLKGTPKPDKFLEFEKKLKRMDDELSKIRNYLADLELITHERINPHTFCLDRMDHKIIDYLIQHKSATTTELGEYLKTNRWLILNRLKRIHKNSRKQLGKPIITYIAEERFGKKRAWWLDEDIISN
jgi:hypothetical protein